MSREAINLEHQCQIAQLKDNFREKLKTYEDWHGKLNVELENEREKHSRELDSLEKSLKHNFKIVIFIFKFFLFTIFYLYVNL